MVTTTIERVRALLLCTTRMHVAATTTLSSRSLHACALEMSSQRRGEALTPASDVGKRPRRDDA
jgi:hypothetical protein